MPLAPPTSRPPAQDPLQAGLGLLSWTIAPYGIAANSNLTSQTLYGVVLPTTAGAVYTGVKLVVNTAGTSTAPTGFFVGLATNGNIGDTGTVLAQSGNLNGSASLTTAGAQNFPFSASYTETATGLRIILILQNGAFLGTNVAFNRTNLAGFYGPNAAQQPLAVTAGTTVTALPANGSPLVAAYSAASPLNWWAGLY